MTTDPIKASESSRCVYIRTCSGFWEKWQGGAETTHIWWESSIWAPGHMALCRPAGVPLHKHTHTHTQALMTSMREEVKECDQCDTETVISFPEAPSVEDLASQEEEPASADRRGRLFFDTLNLPTVSLTLLQWLHPSDITWSTA